MLFKVIPLILKPSIELVNVSSVYVRVHVKVRNTQINTLAQQSPLPFHVMNMGQL